MSIKLLVGRNTVYNAYILQKWRGIAILQIPTAILWGQVATATCSADIT